MRDLSQVVFRIPAPEAALSLRPYALTLGFESFAFFGLAGKGAETFNLPYRNIFHRVETCGAARAIQLLAECSLRCRRSKLRATSQ